MLRRYSQPKPSRGTVVPASLRAEVLAADMGCCVGKWVGMPEDCHHFAGLELDHVRASHGTGMKSSTVRSNLVTLCGNHHRIKTEYGRTWRQPLLDYIARRDHG